MLQFQIQEELAGLFRGFNYIKPIIEKIDREEKLEKLNKLKQHQDLEFVEIGVDDGIK